MHNKSDAASGAMMEQEVTMTLAVDHALRSSDKFQIPAHCCFTFLLSFNITLLLVLYTLLVVLGALSIIYLC